MRFLRDTVMALIAGALFAIYGIIVLCGCENDGVSQPGDITQDIPIQLNPPVGELSVELANDTPAATNISWNATGVIFVRFVLTASATEDIELSGLGVMVSGLAIAADFERVHLYIDDILKGTRLINASNMEAEFVFVGSPATVNAGGSVVAEVKADMSALPGGSQAAFCIQSADDVEAVGVTSGQQVTIQLSGPLCGDLMTVVAPNAAPQRGFPGGAGAGP